ncbi:MAG: SPOR domain-containing protein, partial [Tabrizicola sp.]|nr:SPOR domain-containing protein [Tabrizicola sp.]
MADADYDDFGGGFPTAGPHSMQRYINLAGAVSSVALVIGLGYWGYQLAVRDVRGVPVVQALEGPMRIAPDNPGGEVADYQGLAVNEVAAAGTAAPPPDKLILAPKPVELSLEDASGLAGQPIPEPTPAAATIGTADPALAGQQVGESADPIEAALAEALEPAAERRRKVPSPGR